MLQFGQIHQFSRKATKEFNNFYYPIAEKDPFDERVDHFLVQKTGDPKANITGDGYFVEMPGGYGLLFTNHETPNAADYIARRNADNQKLAPALAARNSLQWAKEQGHKIHYVG